MSWDVYIQDIPDGVRSVSEIPNDFKPRPLGPRDEILERLKRAAPELRFINTTRGRIECAGGSIVVSVTEKDPCDCVTLFVRGGDEVVERVIAIVEALGGKAFDTGSDEGIFDVAKARESMAAWRTYRDQAIKGEGSDAPSLNASGTPRAKRGAWWKLW